MGVNIEIRREKCVVYNFTLFVQVITKFLNENFIFGE